MLGLRLVKPLSEGRKRDMAAADKSTQRRREAQAQPASASRTPTPTTLPVWQIALGLLVLALALGVGLFARSSSTPAAQSMCVTYDQPNQVAEQHPNSATGTLNATLMVIPISMTRARQLIPSQYPILEEALRTAFPGLAADTYPVVLQAAHDHDIQFRAYNMSIPDFSRVGFEFPFIDLLGDGHSPFRWAPAQLITATNEMAIGGSMQYGTVVSPATFEPECNAYARLADGRTSIRAQSIDSRTFAELFVTPMRSPPSREFPMAFLEQILNQPAFAIGSTCDRMQRPFDTPLSHGAFAPKFVKGDVRARLGPFADVEVWRELQGVQVATPFVEDNYLECRTLAA